jgi:hypothetical protein
LTYLSHEEGLSLIKDLDVFDTKLGKVVKLKSLLSNNSC